jgi:AmmeMemoRadiSam system protein A
MIDAPLTDGQRRHLLSLARLAVEATVTAGQPPAVPDHPPLLRPAGAFVTLTAQQELRGCIGYPMPDRPLASVVVRCAALAATEDPRFPRVTACELTNLRIEISVLGALLPVGDPSTIVVGRDGLIVEDGFHRGLLLPQVAVEWGWDRDTFLAHTCRKAGLAPDAWRTGAQLFKFAAEVFAETEPR